MTQTAPRTRLGRAELTPYSRRPVHRRPPLLREVYGQLIRRLRSRQGRTLTDVATRPGVSVAYLSEIERGLKEPSSEVIQAVCTALGSSVAHLVGAAHRELTLESGGAGIAAEGMRAAKIEIDHRDATDEAIEADVLDLTRSRIGRSRAADTRSGAAAPRLCEATLTAA